MASNVFNFSNYHTITVYMHDYNSGKLKVSPLTSLGFSPLENVKVKVLESNGLDIVRAGERFITDVELDSDVQRFCDSIDPSRFKQIDVVKKNTNEKEPMKSVDYAQERYWALTSRLRGYHVTFTFASNIAEHPLVTRPINKIEIEALLGAFCSWYKESLEEEEEEEEEGPDSLIDSDDFYESNTSESDDNLSEFSSSSAESLPPDNYAAQHNYKFFYDNLYNVEVFPEKCNEDRSIVKAVKELCSLQSTIGSLLVIEYNEGLNPIGRHEAWRICDSVVVDLYDNYDAKSCTVFLFGWAHASAWDLRLHSDEGAYYSGINLYGYDEHTHGIVIMGEQNHNTSYNYAMALDENIIVPDLANEDVLIKNN